MTALRPAAGFRWSAVSWGAPDEPPADTCSTCDALIPDEDVPLILWNAEGWCARFCAACQQRWWGFRPLADEEDDR